MVKEPFITNLKTEGHMVSCSDGNARLGEPCDGYFITPKGRELLDRNLGVDTLIDEREKTHGSFKKTSRVSQGLKLVLKDDLTTYNTLTKIQKEGLDMICSKLSRIVSGNPNEKDHWDDIAGYATLVGESLE